MNVRFAENGRDALTALKEDPAVDAILMDVMMPEMDGYETISAIRRGTSNATNESGCCRSVTTASAVVAPSAKLRHGSFAPSSSYATTPQAN